MEAQQKAAELTSAESPQTPVPARRSPWYEQFGKVSVVLLMVALGLLGVYWAFQVHASQEVAHSLPVFILKEAGMAGLIALILNISIEWINRARHAAHQEDLLQQLEKKHKKTSRRLLNEVNEQLFKTVYKRNIDPDVFDLVDECLLKAKVMRRDFSATFTLIPFIDDQGQGTEFVKIHFLNSYRVVNLTDKDVTEPVIKIFLDVTPCYSDHSKFIRLVVGDQHYEGEALAKVVEPIPHRNFIKVVLPHSLPPEDSIYVEIEYEKLAPKDYVEILTTTIPMDRLNLKLIDPQDFFTVDAVSLHPVDEKCKTPPGTRFHAEWDIAKPILPGQGIALLWHPTADPGRQKCLPSQSATESAQVG